MLIYDQHAAAECLKVLEALAIGQLPHYRVLHLNLPLSGAEGRALRTPLLIAAEAHLPTDSQLFWCDDGAVFILCPGLAIKDWRHFAMALSPLLPNQPLEKLVTFHELQHHRGQLLQALDYKLERQRQSQDAQQQAAHAAAAEQRRAALLKVTTDNSQTTALLATRAKHTRPLVMVIEDDLFTLRLVETALKNHYDVIAQADASVALSMYLHKSPHMVFLDINLPDVSGHDLLEKIVALDPEAYVVMLSGNSDRVNIMRAMGAGARGFLGKPFTRDRLVQTVTKCPTLPKKTTRPA